MAYDTYNDLVNSVAGYLKEDGLTSQIGDFILLFEGIEAAKLVHPYAQVLSVVSISASPYDLPSDCAHVRSFGVEGKLPTDEVSYERLYARDRQNCYAVTGADGQQKLFLPTQPESATDYQLLYRKILPNLVNETNWLYQYFPMIYVYGTLLQAEPYLEKDARIQTWNAMYQGAMRALETSAKLIEQGAPIRSAVRVRTRV